MCGRFARALVGPRGPPTCDAIEWNDIAQHLNNAGIDQTGVPSPWVSTSNLLIWVLRMAIKRADPSGRISVIDTSKLDHRAIFHVLPFYNELKKKRPFTKGGFNYRGSHEHLVWHKVPAEAVVKTFSLSQLTSFAAESKALERLLRLDQLATAKSSGSDIIKQLKGADIRINGRVAANMAQVVGSLGLDHDSSREMLARAVSEIAQGWALRAEGTSQDSADDFVQVFCRKSEAYVSIADQTKLKHA